MQIWNARATFPILSFMGAALLLGSLRCACSPANGADVVPPDRSTTWSPGVPGGVPPRTTLYTTLNAATWGNGSADATSAIQAAINACPVGQVVQLSAGEFKITGALSIRKGIVLRGQGPTLTKLKMPVGTSANLITIGQQWPAFTQPTNLAADGVKGSRSVTLVSNPGLAIGELVTIDAITDPEITRWSTKSPLGDGSRGWFSRPNRPVGQVLEIASINGNTLTFTTPLHIGFKTAFGAQLTRFAEWSNGPISNIVKYAGVEDLYLRGGSNGQGNIWLSNAAYCWIKNIESDFQDGPSVALNFSFRCILRDSYIHSTQTPTPGGGGYGISFSWHTSDCLVENNIVWNMNKVMVMRASGGGNVMGYNYMEDSWISYATGWVESGLNASHMTTPHHELFEGNQAFNFDGDNTWGNSAYITVFRNHLTGKRRSIPPLNLSDSGNRRAIGLCEGHWWYTFVGNVLGTSGQNPAPYSGFAYEDTYPWGDDPVGMWKLGYNPENWNAPADPKLLSTLIRGGNFDYVTNSVHWENVTQQALPASLYLSAKPAFFGNLPWPWVDPTGTTKTHSLPARLRFDSMNSSSAPTLTTHPANTTVAAGQTATFSVAALGTAPLAYQWQKNGASISGATGASYSTPAATAADNGATFRVIVSNAIGSVTSNNATLTVSAPVAPTITTHPANRTVVVGQTATFSVTASGTSPFTYQWQKNGAAISGATGASYTTPASTAADNGATFRVIVSNSVGSATSNNATLTVNPAPTTITMGETNVLASADSGNGNLLVAQQATLSQTATLQSLSFYVTAAAGKLRLGVYDASGPGGGPGAKKGETAEMSPIVGWNTANVIAPISLPAGTYWLAYLPSDSGLAFRKESTGSARYYPFTYGTMPAVFSTTPTSEAVHWSLYATLNLSTLPTVTVAATDASASEPGSNTGTFTFTRTGATTAALTVNFAVSGTATSGTDYVTLGTSVTIAAGAISATKTVTPVDNTLAEWSETVIVTIASNAAYTAGTPASATLTIADEDNTAPTIISAASANPNPALTGQNVSFSVAAGDENGDTLTYSWTFGDGASATGNSASHTYAAAGIYAAKVTLNDGHGGTVSSIVSVTVVAAGGIVVDNKHANTSRTPNAWAVSSGANPWAGQSLYSNSGATFRWIPDIPAAGQYEVYAWWTYHPNRSTNVPYAITHAAGTTTVNVNQRFAASGGHWNLLGTFSFNAGSGAFVEVSSVNGQACADAIQWVPVGAAAAAFGAGESAAALAPGALTVNALQVSVNFAKDSGAARLQSTLALPEDFNPAGMTVVVDICGANASFTLDKRGRARTANRRITLKRSKTGWSLAASLKNLVWPNQWSEAGVEDWKSYKGRIEMPALITLGTQPFSGAYSLEVVSGAKGAAGQ